MNSTKIMARPAMFCLVLLGTLQLLLIANPLATAQAADLNPNPPYLTEAPGPPIKLDLTNLPGGPTHQKFGIATHPWWLDVFEDTFISYFKDLKLTVVRLPFEWKVFEPQQGVYNWSREDRLMKRLNDEGFEIVAEFVTVPVWASSNKEVCVNADFQCRLNPQYKPNLGRAAEAVVKRYPFIRYWEFWNEPDIWPNMGSKDISDYAPYLKVFYDGAKRADPTVLVAASTLNGPVYVDWLYRYSDSTFGMRPWDAITYHPYNYDGVLEPSTQKAMSIHKPRIDYLRQLMVQYGDANKPIWLTEIGWEEQPNIQAQNVVDAFNFVASRPYITIATVHMLHDWEGERYGLMRVSVDIFGKRDLNKNDTFVPKQPYYDTVKNYNKRLLPTQPNSTADMLVFSETQLTVRDAFKKAWLRGGIELFGFPKTGQFYERNPSDGKYYLVQYFERVRMEYHPEFKGTPNEILYGLLGNQLLVERGLLNQFGTATNGPALPETKPATTSDRLVWFQQTQHILWGPFLDAWNKQGGLAIVGLPKTQVFEEKNPDDGNTYLVQYFERARMELHPGRNGSPAVILFGLLGNDRLRLQGRILDNNQPNLSDYYNPALPQFS